MKSGPAAAMTATTVTTRSRRRRTGSPTASGAPSSGANGATGMVSNGDDSYTVDGQTFARTYRHVGDAAYVKTTPIWAERADAAGAARPRKARRTTSRRLPGVQPGGWRRSLRDHEGEVRGDVRAGGR